MTETTVVPHNVSELTESKHQSPQRPEPMTLDAKSDWKVWKNDHDHNCDTKVTIKPESNQRPTPVTPVLTAVQSNWKVWKNDH
ncbi:hypothetical protein TrRE_jg9394 [Triparma retinervis]|uniref:Uncharacterized protein n=1 Tax=Triparma retinervis TaxID=2557542 RepID=A0A9W6ZUX4_9STRA|nr:hypothetical protein TrRE_jg9394 [Triparma retinervis]